MISSFPPRRRTGLVLALLLLAGPAGVRSATDARIFLERGTLRASGLTLAGPPAPTRYRALPGPRGDLTGLAATGAPIALAGTLPEPLRDRGSLQFWFRTDQIYRTGSAAPKFTEKLVELPGALTVSFVAEQNALTLFVEWQGKRAEVFERHIRVILPEFPGPAWHHVAVNWDGPAGRVNAFLDGTPYHLATGAKEPPLPVPPATGLTLHLGRFALAEVHLTATPVAENELRALVGDAAWGALDRLLGVRDYGPAPLESARGARLYAAALGGPADTRGWVIEGPATVEFQDGWMQMKSQRPDGPEGHLVHWCPVEFPERFWAEWDFELLGEQGLCIVFFAARGQGGRDVFDPSLAPRNGIFRQYHSGDIDCYHVSYFANTPGSARRVANLRKNSGFYLVANGPVGVTAARAGEVHRAVLVKDGARLRMAVDGRTIIDHTDDGRRAGPIWAGGKIGLRQMQWTVGRYRNFQVYALK
jgi:hypothetical protein